MDGELKPVLVLIYQPFDFNEIVLLEGVERVLDVVPHLGFQMTRAICQSESQIRLA